MQCSRTIENAIVELLPHFTAAHAFAVRSSALGDARGTGVYNSNFSGPTLQRLLDSVATVVASHFTPAAREFRRVTSVAPGIAVSIEPLIGTEHEEYIGKHRFCQFSPVMGGFGYTDSSSGPYLMGAYGFGDEVVHDSSQGLRIIPQEVSGDDENSADYLFALENKIINYGGISRIHSRVWSDGDIGNSDERDHHALSRLSFAQIFESMKRLQVELKAPQYFEWVAARVADSVKVFLTQIADLNVQHDFFDLPQNAKRVLGFGREVMLGGDVTVQSAIFYNNPCNLQMLAQYNAQHPEGYLFVVDSRFLSRTSRQKLDFSHYSNAKAILIVSCGMHTTGVFSHFEGSAIESSKLVGLLDFGVFPLMLARELGIESKRFSEGLDIVTHPLRIVANDSKKNPLIRTGLMVLAL